MTYLEWNNKLANYYLSILGEKDFFLLNADESILLELNSYKEDSLEDFRLAIKMGPEDKEKNRFDFNPKFIGQKQRSRFNFIIRAFWLKEVWRKKSTYNPYGTYGNVPIWNNEETPPYLAYLFFLILNTDKYGEESKYWSYLSKVSDDKVDSNDGSKIIELFKDFQNHTEQKFKSKFYYTNIYPRGGRKYVGTICSQLPLKSREKVIVTSFFRDCGIEKSDIEVLTNQELISSMVNTGIDYFERNTIDIIKQCENPILVDLIIYELRKVARNNEDWQVDLKSVVNKAKERIKSNARLHLVFYKSFEQFTLRVSSEQDFDKLHFDNGYSVVKQEAYLSENIKDSQNKSIPITDFCTIPKFRYEEKTLKHSFNKDYILLSYSSKDIFIESQSQESKEAYLVVFKETEDVKKLVEENKLEILQLSKNTISGASIYKTNGYLNLNGLEECNPRITFKGGAKKDTGLYSRYWLPQINFHYASDCKLEIIDVLKESACPDYIDLEGFKDKLQGKDKITIILKRDNEYVSEKELFIDVESELSVFDGCSPVILDGFINKVQMNKFDSKLHFQIKSTVEYDWSKDKLLIELSSVAGKNGFIPSKKFSSILYSYIKEFSGLGDKTDYVKDLRDPLVKMLQGFGYIKKEYDRKGNYKGVFISAPYLLPISIGSEMDAKYVLRGARNRQMIDKLLELSRDRKITCFEQRKAKLFSNQDLNEVFPSEIYLSTPLKEEYVNTISPRQLSEYLGITLVDISIEQSMIEMLPKSFDSLKNNRWFGELDFNIAVDNPLCVRSEDYTLPVLLAFQSSAYLQHQYVIFEGSSQFTVEKNWGLFYIKIAHTFPILYYAYSWDISNRKYSRERLFIKEREPIPEEIFTILCIANRELPKLISLKINGSNEDTYYEFERIDIRIIDQIVNCYNIKHSIINISNPSNQKSELIPL